MCVHPARRVAYIPARSREGSGSELGTPGERACVCIPRGVSRTYLHARRLGGPSSEAGGQFGALTDRALGVEFGRQRRTADDVRLDPVAAQAVLQVADGFLAGADHHVVDREQPCAAPIRAEADVQAVVVDELI